MTHPVLAAQMYTVREFTQTLAGFVESMQKVQAIGYTAVQISAISPDISDEDVKRVADDTGLTICNTHVRPADALWNDMDAVIKQHQLWACQHVAIGGMPAEYRESGEDGYKRFAVDGSKIGEQLAEAGLTFSYHNHNFEYVRFGKRNGMEIIFDESDPNYLQAELDTYWVQYGGADPIAWINKMKNRLPVIHLKDMAVEGHEPIMAEVGEGNLNWPAILQACKDSNVEWYAIEQDRTYGRDPFESLKISYDNLRAMGIE